jgi:hypothetical protein
MAGDGEGAQQRRRSELRVASTTQALYDRFCAQLERTARAAVGDLEQRARPVVSAYGAGKLGSSRRGGEAAPTTRRLREVRRHFRVVMVDEHRTS